MMTIKLQSATGLPALSTVLTHLKKTLLCLSLLVLTAGCSTIVTISPARGIEARTLEEFNLYADEVFRRQSEANSKIIMYLIDYETGNKTSQYEQLMAAEEKIVDACKNLNNMAVTRAEEREVTILQRYIFANSVGECDNATSVIEGLLQEL